MPYPNQAAIDEQLANQAQELSEWGVDANEYYPEMAKNYSRNNQYSDSFGDAHIGYDPSGAYGAGLTRSTYGTDPGWLEQPGHWTAKKLGFGETGQTIGGIGSYTALQSLGNAALNRPGIVNKHLFNLMPQAAYNKIPGVASKLPFMSGLASRSVTIGNPMSLGAFSAAGIYKDMGAAYWNQYKQQTANGGRADVGNMLYNGGLDLSAAEANNVVGSWAPTIERFQKAKTFGDYTGAALSGIAPLMGTAFDLPRLPAQLAAVYGETKNIEQDTANMEADNASLDLKSMQRRIKPGSPLTVNRETYNRMRQQYGGKGDPTWDRALAMADKKLNSPNQLGAINPQQQQNDLQTITSRFGLTSPPPKPTVSSATPRTGTITPPAGQAPVAGNTTAPKPATPPPVIKSGSAERALSEIILGKTLRNVVKSNLAKTKAPEEAPVVKHELTETEGKLLTAMVLNKLVAKG